MTPPTPNLMLTPPLIVSPLTTHRTTLIILHGRGSSAEKFAQPLLHHPVSTSSTFSSSPEPSDIKSFQTYLPDTRFVFPTAPLRRAAAFNRSLIHQWFDSWSLASPEIKPHLQIRGLRETTAYLHGLLEREIAQVGEGRVVLMGLSQGCAASLVAGMLWEGKALGGVVGMCGYLPFVRDMHECVEAEAGGGNGGEKEEGEEGHGEVDIFQREDDVEECRERSQLNIAVQWLREELEVLESGYTRDERGHGMQSVSLFMGHGVQDEKVPVGLGRKAKAFLESVGVEVVWSEYKGLGHWYNEDMLRDVIGFIKGLEGWRDGEE